MTSMDKTLVCRDCGQEFMFSSGEQEFFQSRGLLNEPGRCPECRSARKRERPVYNSYGATRQYTAVCASCGREASVPFEPKQGRPVYCRACFSQRQHS